MNGYRMSLEQIKTFEQMLNDLKEFFDEKYFMVIDSEEILVHILRFICYGQMI